MNDDLGRLGFEGIERDHGIGLPPAPEVPEPPAAAPRKRGRGPALRPPPNRVADLDARAKAIATRLRANKPIQVRVPLPMYAEVVRLCEERNVAVHPTILWLLEVGLRYASDFSSPYNDAPFARPENGHARVGHTFRDVRANRVETVATNSAFQEQRAARASEDAKVLGGFRAFMPATMTRGEE